MIDKNKNKEAADNYADARYADEYLQIIFKNGWRDGQEWLYEHLWHKPEGKVESDALILAYTTEWKYELITGLELVKNTHLYLKWLYIKDLLK